MAKRALPRWCKEAQKAMIESEFKVEDVAKQLGRSKQYISGVIHGRVYSETMINQISFLLKIDNSTYYD